MHPLQQTLKDLERAYTNFFAKRVDFPRIKKKGQRDSFHHIAKASSCASRWYLRYELSVRDLVEMISERGLSLAHTTIMSWVKLFTPEFV